MSGCAFNDHSRTFTQDIECQGDVYVETEVLLEKSSLEESSATQTTSPNVSVPAGILK